MKEKSYICDGNSCLHLVKLLLGVQLVDELIRESHGTIFSLAELVHLKSQWKTNVLQRLYYELKAIDVYTYFT